VSATERYEDELGGHYDEPTGNALSAAPDVVEIRRNAGVAALVGVLASGVAIAYLARAAQTGAVLDWVLFGVMTVLGAAYLHAFLDARTPLLLADAQGVRLRLGRAWRGLPWGALAIVQHTPRRGLFHDGRLVLHPHNTEWVLSELDASGRRQSRLSEKLYGAPFALPLGLSTRVTGATEDLTTTLRQLAGDATQIIEPEAAVAAPVEPEVTEPDAAEAAHDVPGHRPAEPVVVEDAYEDEDEVEVEVEAPPEVEADEHVPLLHDPRPGLATVISRLATRTFTRRERDEVDAEQDEEDDALEPADEDLAEQPTSWIVASATPSPLRETRGARRAEVRADVPADDEEPQGPEGRELRRPGSVNLVEDTQVWGDRVHPIARPGEAVDPLVIDDFEVEPAADPVVGPELVAARTRLGLTVDQLAERTRIRPHVIESIEVDDFAPCGGDFYARGHLRTLARVLGVDAVPLLRAYDDKYADAPINPRRVFEAELATGSSGGIRSTRGGPNWSVLIAAIMTLVLAWSIARLVMDTPVLLQSPAPSLLNGSDGPSQPDAGAPARVTLKTTAVTSTHLKIVNGNGKVVFDADVPAGEIHRFDIRPPAVVSSPDGDAIRVQINANDRGALGKPDQPAKKTFRANAN
jgi:hypothetical protein